MVAHLHDSLLTWLTAYILSGALCGSIICVLIWPPRHAITGAIQMACCWAVSLIYRDVFLHYLEWPTQPSNLFAAEVSITIIAWMTILAIKSPYEAIRLIRELRKAVSKQADS